VSLQFEIKLRSYINLTSLLQYTATVFVYVKCEVMQNMIT